MGWLLLHSILLLLVSFLDGRGLLAAAARSTDCPCSRDAALPGAFPGTSSGGSSVDGAGILGRDSLEVGIPLGMQGARLGLAAWVGVAGLAAGQDTSVGGRIPEEGILGGTQVGSHHAFQPAAGRPLGCGSWQPFSAWGPSRPRPLLLQQLQWLQSPSWACASSSAWEAGQGRVGAVEEEALAVGVCSCRGSACACVACGVTSCVVEADSLVVLLPSFHLGARRLPHRACTGGACLGRVDRGCPCLPPPPPLPSTAYWGRSRHPSPFILI